MKRVLFTILQFVLFLLLFAVGSFLLPLLNVSYITHWANGARGFQWDGVLLMLILFVLILLGEAARKRMHPAAQWTTIALILAAIAGIFMKFGFLTLD